MNILDKIIAHKIEEVAQRKATQPIAELEKSPFLGWETVSLKKALLEKGASGIIAEFKRKSPSAGVINDQVSVEAVTTEYVQTGVSGLSILTDKDFFGGRSEDVQVARVLHKIPILRKDFIVDEYQILEAKAMGADVILLIAECLEIEQVAQLAAFAKSLGLEVLMEIHSAEQLEKLNSNLDLVGVNNRNLKTMVTSLEASYELAEQIPAEFVKISESGISNPQAVVSLRSQGYRGFLMGEHFMKTANPGEACGEFIRKVAYMEDLLHNAIV
ncbi:MAG: indole-3-glycerol phosphate synthase TrpC [Saprospiraceae bacterium]|nr:indole-3-glycerol phosphate synthase TrpC [Saprospiraceae bacterium]